MYSKDYKLDQTVIGGRKNVKFHLGQKKTKEEGENLNETDTVVEASDSIKNHNQKSNSKNNTAQEIQLVEEDNQSVDNEIIVPPKIPTKHETPQNQNQNQKKVVNNNTKVTYENSGPSNKIKQQTQNHQNHQGNNQQHNKSQNFNKKN